MSKRDFSLALSPTDEREIFFLLAIVVPASIIDRSLILHALCSTSRVDTVGTLCSPLKDWPPTPIHLVSLKMRVTHQTSHGNYPQKGLQCSMGMESEEEKKKEHQGENPICAGQQTAARFINFVVKEKSRVAISALAHWEACPGLASELKWGLGTLFHRFSMPQTVSLFLESSLFF